MAVDKPDAVFAVVIREIQKIHRQATSEPPGKSCLEESGEFSTSAGSVPLRHR